MKTRLILKATQLGQSFRMFAMKDSITEKQLKVAIGVHLLQKLTGKVHGNSSTAGVKCPCGCNGTVPVGDMWIGSSETWHGELDLIGGDKATSIRVKESGDDETQETIDDETLDDNEEIAGCSTDNSSSLEIKKRPPTLEYNMCEVIGQAIVFGWTKYNRHPNMCPYIPTLLVVNGKFVPFLYNPVNDELLSTDGFIDMERSTKP